MSLSHLIYYLISRREDYCYSSLDGMPIHRPEAGTFLYSKVEGVTATVTYPALNITQLPSQGENADTLGFLRARHLTVQLIFIIRIKRAILVSFSVGEKEGSVSEIVKS